jgi:hypothetical protein
MHLKSLEQTRLNNNLHKTYLKAIKFHASSIIAGIDMFPNFVNLITPAAQPGMMPFSLIQMIVKT